MHWWRCPFLRTNVGIGTPIRPCKTLRLGLGLENVRPPLSGDGIALQIFDQLSGALEGQRLVVYLITDYCMYIY